MKTYDIAVIGAGPAGMTAGAWRSLKRIIRADRW